jgi:DNA uptake protein ComE-like DNA-binding protein
MSDFLDFLNTADMNVLVKVPGITRALAGNLIAARPFDTVDDCLKIHGMGKSLLTRLQSAYEMGEASAAEEPAPENRAVVAVEETPSAPIEKSPPAQEEPKAAQPSFFARLGKAALNIFISFLRLLLMLALIAGVGAAFYYGVPYFNEKLIIPIEKNTASIREMEKQIADLQSQVDEANARVDAVEQDIESHAASLKKLEEIQTTLETEITAQNNSVMVALKREVMFTRAIETLARARLYLSQSNFGLAKQDVQSARDLLAALKTDAPKYQLSALDSILARLDLALGNLPAFPVIAANDVDIAWELMLMGLPESAAEVTPTPAP